MSPLISKISQVQKDVKSIYDDGVIGITNSTVQLRDIMLFKQVVIDDTKVKCCLHHGYIELGYIIDDVNYIVLI